MSVDGDGAVGGGSDAEDGLAELGAAGAHESGDANDFAGVEGELDAGEFYAEAFGRTLGDGRQGLALVDGGDFASDHVVNDLVGGEIDEGAAVDGAAVAEDGDAVGDGVEFGEAVGDVDDAHAARAKVLCDAEDGGGFGVGERGRGLVEDEQAGCAVEGAADFDELLLGGAEFVDAGGGVEGEAVFIDEAAGFSFHAALVEQGAAQGFAAEEDVLGDSEVRGEEGFLMDHRDAGLMGFGGAGEVGGLALPAHVAAVSAEHAGDDLHQSGFAGSVLADEGMDFTGVDLKVAALESGDASEVFFDGLEVEEHGAISKGERCKVAQVRAPCCWSRSKVFLRPCAGDPTPGDDRSRPSPEQPRSGRSEARQTSSAFRSGRRNRRRPPSRRFHRV